MGKVYFVMPLAEAPKKKPKTKIQRKREKILASRRKRYAPLKAGDEVGGQRAGTWPQRSLTMAVHPTQVEEANARQAAHKTGCYHDRTGKLVCPDAASKKRAMKLNTTIFNGKRVGLVDYESFS